MADLTFGELSKECPIDELMKKTSCKVFIPLRIALKLDIINKEIRPEWGVALIGTEEEVPEKENENIMARIFQVTDIYIPEQKVDATNFNFVDEEGNDASAYQVEQMVKEEFGDDARVIGSLHRHPGTMSSFSHNDAFSCFSMWPLGMLMIDGTILENIVCYLDYPLPHTCSTFHGNSDSEQVFRYYPIKVAFSYKGIEEEDEVLAQIKARISKKTFQSTVVHKTYQQGQFGHDGTSEWQKQQAERRAIEAAEKAKGNESTSETHPLEDDGKLEEKLRNLGYTCVQGIWNPRKYPVNRQMANTIGV